VELNLRPELLVAIVPGRVRVTTAEALVEDNSRRGGGGEKLAGEHIVG
jgi:hypothetical protein